jgi:hypothetical protein
MVLTMEPDMTLRHVVTASILPDGRHHLSIHYPDSAGFANYKPAEYTTVRNIDGSNRFMRDGGGWQFLPHDYELEKSIEAALKALDKVLAMWRPGEYPFEAKLLGEIREAAKASMLDDFPSARHEGNRRFEFLMTPVVSKLLLGTEEPSPAIALQAIQQAA